MKKPPETPSPLVFGLVWPALEVLHAASGYRLLRHPQSPRRAAAIALWVTNSTMIGGWSALFFGAKRLKTSAWAAAAMALIQAAFTAKAGKLDPKGAAIDLPLLGWLAFAAWLSASIARRNH